MPQVRRWTRVVTQIAQLKSGIATKTIHPKRGPPSLDVFLVKGRQRTAYSAEKAISPPLRIPPNFFADHFALSWGKIRFTGHPLFDSVVHVLLPHDYLRRRATFPESTNNSLVDLSGATIMLSNVEIASTPTADTPGSAVVVQYSRHHRRV